MSAGVLQPLVSVCCSLICPWINYCNGILYSTPNDTIKLQGVQMYSGSFFECQDNAMPNRWYTAYTGGAKDNVQAVSDHTSTPVYLSHHLQTHNYTQDLQSSDTPLLSLPCCTTVFGGRGFCHSTIQHHVSGTHFLGQYSIASHCQLLKLS